MNFSEALGVVVFCAIVLDLAEIWSEFFNISVNIFIRLDSVIYEWLNILSTKKNAAQLFLWACVCFFISNRFGKLSVQYYFCASIKYSVRKDAIAPTNILYSYWIIIVQVSSIRYWQHSGTVIDSVSFAHLSINQCGDWVLAFFTFCSFLFYVLCWA